jgi:hypothetical protein
MRASTALVVPMAASLAALASTPRIGAGQGADADSVMRAVNQLRVGSRVRLVTATERVGYGTYSGVDSTGLLWTNDSGRASRLEADQLLRLDVERRNTGKGAKVVGTIGVVAGGLLGWALTDACDSSLCDSNAKVILGSVALLGSGGALLGALIGSAGHSWHPVYARPGG